MLILLVKPDSISTQRTCFGHNLLQQNILPHFLAETFKIKHATFISFFLLAVLMYNVILCAYYVLFCEGQFLCSKQNNGRICKGREKWRRI